MAILRVPRPLRADILIVGQLAEVLDEEQVAVVPLFGTRPILPLDSLSRHGSSQILFAIETIRTVAGLSGLALSTEEWILEFAVLTAERLDLGFKMLGPTEGVSAHGGPRSELLPEFGVLAPEISDFLA